MSLHRLLTILIMFSLIFSLSVSQGVGACSESQMDYYSDEVAVGTTMPYDNDEDRIVILGMTSSQIQGVLTMFTRAFLG